MGDASKVNQLSPVWMQVEHEKPGPDPLRPHAILVGVRQESNRQFLVERQQPLRSIFDIGTTRHNVHSTEDKEYWQKKAVETGNVSNEPQRLVNWKEPQKYIDNYHSQVKGKIGSIHFS